MEQCAGGVARNIAEALWRLRNGRTRLLTAIGDDNDGQYLQNIAQNLILDGCVVKNARTAKYAAIFDANGECKLGLGDMAIHDHISVNLVNKHIDVLKNSRLIVIDGNVPTSTMDYVLELCNKYGKPGLTIELGTYLDLTSFVIKFNNQGIYHNTELGSHGI